MKPAITAAVLFLGLVTAGPASAQTQSAETQEHGAFSVVRQQTKQGVSCKLTVIQTENNRLFHLSLGQDAGQMFIAIYVSNLDPLRGHAMSFQIDQREVIRFDPPRAGKAGEAIIGIHVEMDDERMQQALKDAAGDPVGQDGHVLEVVADDFRFAIPSSGLKEAVADYFSCRHDRSL